MKPSHVTSAADVIAARAALGLTQPALARLLRLGADGAKTIRNWESGRHKIAGPAAVALEALLAGWRPVEAPLEVDAAGVI